MVVLKPYVRLVLYEGWLAWDRSARSQATRRLTIPIEVTSSPARASAPSSSDISWTYFCVSRVLGDLARSWDNFALKLGWVEMWTLAGSECDMLKIANELEEHVEHKSHKVVR